jgi:hypothetical protein
MPLIEAGTHWLLVSDFAKLNTGRTCTFANCSECSVNGSSHLKDDAASLEHQAHRGYGSFVKQNMGSSRGRTLLEWGPAEAKGAKPSGG